LLCNGRAEDWQFRRNCAFAKIMRAITRTLPPSNAPNAEFRRHHSVEPPEISRREFRPGWRRKTRLAALVACGRLDRGEIEAALVWRSWYETLGRVRTQRWVARIDQASQPDALSQRELVAARSLKDASAAIGARRTRLLTALLIDDLPWTVMAKRFKCERHTIVEKCVEALIVLARWTTGTASSRARRTVRARRNPVAVEKINQTSEKPFGRVRVRTA